MKAKIFARLKQEYSSLGLGDEVLMARAGALAATGLVTDENIDAVVAVQKADLEGLQKHADKRVTDALEKERKKREEEAQKKIAEEEARKKAEKEAQIVEDARKAEESAQKRAEEEANKKAAEEQAKKKAEEDARKNQAKSDEDKPKEYTKPSNGVDTSYLRELESKLQKLTSSFEQFTEASKTREQEYNTTIKNLSDSKAKLEEKVQNLVSETETARMAKERAEHQAKIIAKAKELGVPEWRINEGFTIAEDASDETISGVLTMVANNINTHLLPSNKGFNPLSDNKPSEEEIKELAKIIVK